MEIANVSFKPQKIKKQLKNSQYSIPFKNYFKPLPITHLLVHLLITQNSLFKHVILSGIIINFKNRATM